MRSLLLLLLAAIGCSSAYDRRDPAGERFPSVIGTSLRGEERRLPEDFAGAPVILLIGYEQDAQFDIDRWLLGLSQAGVTVRTYEVPTIRGMFPRMFAGRIDDGMRKGIPSEDWGSVVTVYGDADKITRFTGNQNKSTGRALLLDAEGHVAFFHDRGYSVGALQELRTAIEAFQKGEETVKTTKPAFEPVLEASLPEGFPAPGPLGKVVRKSYPRYRAARADGANSFWTLFNHIKNNDIAMTAPVASRMVEEGNSMQRRDMAFLYASPELGRAGADGAVEVVDLEPQKVLSYGIRGPLTEDKLQEARAAIETELASSEKREWRLLGYNSPKVPAASRFWELQTAVAAREAREARED